MIGHSSVLIEIGGMRILTDPYFGVRGNLAYTRVNPPACSREELRDVDLVLVSHNHFDHSDSAFLKMLPESTPVAAPAKTAWFTKLKGARNVAGMRPWQSQKFGHISVTAVPAYHSTVTHGYVLRYGAEVLYFAGDTYYGKFMERIGKEYRPNVALMPVASFRLPPTMGTKGALAAAKSLSPEVIVPIHLGITPRNPLLRGSQTPQMFEEELNTAGLPSKLVVLKEGESWQPAAAAISTRRSTSAASA